MKPCSIQVMGGTALSFAVVALSGTRSLPISDVLFEVTCADLSDCDGRDRVCLLSAPLLVTVYKVFVVFYRQYVLVS